MAHEAGTSRKGRRIYRIRLSDGGRAELRQLVDSGAAAYRRQHARIRLLADGVRDERGRRERRNRKPRSPAGEGGAKLVALACPQPLEGRSRWTMRLLADRPGGLEIVSTIP